ncbi:MAG: hypothetical protein U0176_17805 [Bacteroidia bacterium]
MKRIAILLPLLAGLAGPLAVSEVSAALPRGGTFGALAPTFEVVAELPWSTVSAVLEAVTDVRPYTYDQLVSWYQVGRVTVEQVGSGYRVTVLNDDGILDIDLIEGL